MPATIPAPFLTGIADMIALVSAESVKTAAAKKAGDEAGGDGSGGKDPGHKGGKSTHQTAQVDGGTHPATLGEHGKELTTDLKKMVPNSTAEASPLGDRDNQYQVGTRKSSVGDDPQTENAFKSRKDDPGTTCPANASVGEKYSLDQQFDNTIGMVNNLLARMSNGELPTKAAAAGAAATSTTAALQINLNDDAGIKAAAAAGYELSEIAAAINKPADSIETAKVAIAADVVSQLQQEGWLKADLVADFLHQKAVYDRALIAGQKRANDPTSGAMDGAASPDLPAAGAAPMEATPAGSGSPDPGGAAGPGAGPDGAGGEDEMVAEMAHSILASGVNPEKLIEALVAAHGASPDGAIEGEAPNHEGKMARWRYELPTVEQIYKAACDATNYLRGGKYKFKTARDKKAQDARDQTAAYISHVAEVLKIR